MENKHFTKEIYKDIHGKTTLQNMNSHQDHVCSGCDMEIQDKFLFSVNDVYWHESCLECSACHCPLTESCYSKDNKLFCSTDYRRLFAMKCNVCKQGIAANELVMRAMQNVYHLHCFKCEECGRTLEKGDEFGLKDRRLYCKEDLNGIKREKESSPDSTIGSDKSEPASPAPSDLSCDTKSPKRPRTILTSSQRKAFKAAFEMTPKPCRKVREELSRDTGLSVRVVQVWFQNQRAKLKKMAKKNNPPHDHDAKLIAKAKKKHKSKVKSNSAETNKKRACLQECGESIKDQTSTSSSTFANQMQPYENLRGDNNYPLIAPPNLQPFYTSTTQQNADQTSCFNNPSQNELAAPPPYSMSHMNYQVQDTNNVMENRIQGFYEFGNAIGSSFLDQLERGRTHNQIMNQTLNSY